MTKRKRRKHEESTPEPRYVSTGGGAYITGDVRVGGDFIGRDETGEAAAPPLDLDSAEAAAARVRYLAALRERYNVIETHAYTALAQDEQVGSLMALTFQAAFNCSMRRCRASDLEPFKFG